MLQGECRLSYVWGFDQFCIVSFNVHGLNYRIRFAKESEDYWNTQVGKAFPYRQSGSVLHINPFYPVDDPNYYCWLEAYRGH